MKTINADDLIGEIVAIDYRKAAVFTSYGIDFCCHGNRSVQEACDSAGIYITEVLTELNKALPISESTVNIETMPIGQIIEYIRNVHHKYVRQQVPVIKEMLSKVVKVHGHNHPELIEVYELFDSGVDDLLIHLGKEEQILFPMILRLSEVSLDGGDISEVPFSLEVPMHVMKNEHAIEGDRYKRISDLTCKYSAPQEACTTYKTVFQLLKEFEEDLHKHIHLENNVLFPAASLLEESL